MSSRRSKFSPDVLESLFEEDFAGFDLRIRQWLALNPRPKFPALPEAILSDESSSDSVDAWSIEEEVRKHRYYAATPDRSRNPDNDADLDDSVVFLQEIKKK